MCRTCRARMSLDADAFAEHEGGFAAAAALLGNHPALYHADTTDPDRSTIRTLREEVARVLRARATNPRWLAGQMRHGFRGAAEIAQTVDNFFAYAALTDVVDNHQFDLLFDATIGDETVRTFPHRRQPGRGACHRRTVRRSNPARVVDHAAQLSSTASWPGCGRLRDEREQRADAGDGQGVVSWRPAANAKRRRPDRAAADQWRHRRHRAGSADRAMVAPLGQRSDRPVEPRQSSVARTFGAAPAATCTMRWRNAVCWTSSAAGEAVRNVISSPLAGLDPGAVLDIRPIAARSRAAACRRCRAA